MNLSDPIEAALSYRRKVAWKRSPEENLRLFCELQRAAVEVLEANPAAKQHFNRRNHRKRRQSEADRQVNRTFPSDAGEAS